MENSESKREAQEIDHLLPAVGGGKHSPASAGTAGSTAPVRVSISLNEREATFLHAMLRDTGAGGPLWMEEDTIGGNFYHSPDEPNPYTKEERAAVRRLLRMLKRARDAHLGTAR